MVQNYLSISGTVQGIQGNDAKAPYAYWNRYTYRPVTSGELSSLRNGDFQTQALSLSPGQYTCLEISFNEPVYVSQFRCYLTSPTSPIEVALSYPHLTENPSSYVVDMSVAENVGRENYYGSARYYDRVSSCVGYIEGDPVALTTGEYTQLISAIYLTAYSGSLPSIQSGFENKQVKQIIEIQGDHSLSQFAKLQLTAPPVGTVNLDQVSIAPIDTQEEHFDFSSNTTDDDHRDELRYWYSDEGPKGHFEGEMFTVTPGATITGTWTEYLAWSGLGPKSTRDDLQGYTIRQPIPSRVIEYLGDGLRVTLSGLQDQDVSLRHMSYMPSNSTEVKLEFGSSLDIYRENLKNSIDRWKNDGSDDSGWEGQLSRHFGHFESYQVDVDDGSQAIMYSENVIGIPCQSHGLKAGDYIRVYGTEFYDGYYYVLTYSTPHIIVIWGIFDPETFTDAAKIRKVVSLGPLYDDYGVKQDCRAVVPYTEINLVTGRSAYILDYSNFGKTHASVKVGPEEEPTAGVVSIYDITVDDGWLCNSPGPSTTPDFEQKVPNPRTEAKKRFWDPRESYDDRFSTPDIGSHDGGHRRIADELWKGKFSCISESYDPDYEGDATGRSIDLLFDRKMAQPWSCLISLADCPWVTMSYRGPIPVKFIIDMGEPKLFSKYRYWLQLFICPPDTLIGYPRSWKVEASNHGNNNLEWDLLEDTLDFPLDNFTASNYPPDLRIPGSCAEMEWKSYKNVELYRYYRFHIHESWTCTRKPGHFECAHVDEIDFVEHRCTAGIFPVVINSSLYMDRIEKIIPDEHLRADSKIFYAITFDDGVSYEMYRHDTEAWRTIARQVEGQWQYFDGLIWRTTDPDRPEENTVKFALWYAFSVKDNRMDSASMQAITEPVYQSKIPNGGFLKFVVGLVSSSKIEAILKSITIMGTVFNPSGSDAPTEVTFNNGQSGCTIPSGQVIISDWINSDVVSQRDALFVMDLATTASSVPLFSGYGRDVLYFYRPYVQTYDVQTVEANDYTLASGIILIDSMETRNSDSITLPVPGHNLPVGAYVRVSGTFNYYDGYHDVYRARTDNIEIVSKHWVTANPVPSGAYVQRRYSIGPGNMQPHTQVGSVLEFSDVGHYWESVVRESPASNFYFVTSDACSAISRPSHILDPDGSTEYHSGQAMSYGPVNLAIRYSQPKQYDKFRLRASSNPWFWSREFPSSMVIGGSNLASPVIGTDAHWTTVWSGSPAAPGGPGSYSDWNTVSLSGSYTNYRIHITDNIGEWFDAIRFAGIDFANSGTASSGVDYTFLDSPPGFEAKHLFDGIATSDYATVVHNTYPAVAVDFHNKPRELTRFRMKAALGNLTPASGTWAWDDCYPKTLALYGSNSESPALEDPSYWTSVAAYNHPTLYEEGQWGDWIDVGSGIDPYRHYKVEFYSNQAGGDITTQTFFVNATDALPKKIFTLPVGSMLTEVKVETPTAFRGGYTGGCGTIGSGDVGYQHIDQCYYSYETNMAPHAPLPLEYGRYIVQAGIRRRGGSVTWMKFQRVQVDGSNVMWDDTCYDGNGDAIFDVPGNRFCCGPYTYSDTAGQWVVDWKEFYFGPYKHMDLGVYYPAIRTAWEFRTNTNNDVSFSPGGNSWMRIVSSTSTLPPPNNKSGDFYATGAVADVAVRYGNKYKVTVSGTGDPVALVTDIQPYATSEISTWVGAYGPYASTRDIHLDLHRPYDNKDTSGQIKITVKYSQVDNSEIAIRASELDFEYKEATSKILYPAYDNSYPLKLYDLPPWHEVTGGAVSVQTGFTGGYAEQVGNVASGTEDNSFWTIVDRHWKLQNGRAINQVGLYSDQPGDIFLKMFKQQASDEWFDIAEIQTITHSGTGFQWFTLNRPYLIPDSGDQYMGWYQANFPVKMAEATGSGLVSYQYGNYTGTNINLPLHNTMKPCIAVRYSDCFSIGTDNEPELLCSTFSPAVSDREWVINNLEYSLDARSLNIYRQCNLTQSGTQGTMKVTLYYKDVYASDYGSLDFSVRDNGYLDYTRTAQNLVDGDSATDLYSYKEVKSGRPLSFVSRFDVPVRLVAFRYRPSTALWLGSFPQVVELSASNSYADPSMAAGWASIYEDSAYLKGDAPLYWGPWVYLDHYSDFYTHYLFKVYTELALGQVAGVGDVELLIQYQDTMWVEVPEVYNVVAGITNEGMFDKQVTTRSHPGLSRHIKSVLNTFSSYGQNELSPGTYFYRGENTPWDVNPHPVRVTRTEGNTEQEVKVTHPFFAGMDILAWHSLREESGSFMDQSGNGVEAVRIGVIDSMLGRQQEMAAYKENDQVEGNVAFTMPHHLDEYTVAFWFLPKHNIYQTYEVMFDIMGGYISYGAIPGAWHVSMAKHMMLTEDPYPPVQNHEPNIQNPQVGGLWGRMCFGNYGARLETSRYYWRQNTWYHVAFGFKAGATESNPYQCWINGVPDTQSYFRGHDGGYSVYPPTDVIMADPEDIHYDTHGKHNCMYFGLPLEDGPGLPYEFALQNVMHFNKLLNDEEVFRVYRARPSLLEEWDGIYFADTVEIESPGKIIVDLGEPKCITKYGFITPSGSTDNVWWRLLGSGIEGTKVLDERYADFLGMPDYYNILNPEQFQYYVIDILGSDDKADYLFFNGLRMVDVPHIPTVSGVYQTVTSGVQESNILEISTDTYTPSGAQIAFSLSRDEGQTWWPVEDLSSLDKCYLDTLGSGTLYTRHVFTSGPILEYPAVLGFDSLQTTWSAGAPTIVTVPLSFSDGAAVDSDWFQYSLDQATHHYVIFDFSSTGGNPSYSENGYGYFVDGSYTCSGSYLASEIESRQQEIVSIKTGSVADVSPGNIVGIQNAGPYNGYWYTASGGGDDLWIYAPYESYSMPAGAVYRRVIEEAFNPGAEIVVTSGSSVVVSTDGNTLRLRDDLPSQEITAVYNSILGDHGVEIAREVRVDERAGEATNVIHLNLTSNTTPSPYRVFERTEDPNLYKLLNGTVSGTNGVTSMVVDMGSAIKINGYRWFYDYPTGSGSTPDYWEVYTSDNLPHWDLAIAEEDNAFRWGWSDNYDLPTTSGHRYYLFKFYEEVRLKQIELLQKDVPLSTDAVVVKTTTSGRWSYSNAGRLSTINVLSDEPAATHIFHAITTDSGSSYKIWDEGAWLSTVRLNGADWQYYDTSWHNSSENSVYGAFRQSVEDASQMFSTPQLESVQEASWGLTSTSGSLGFISYLASYGNSTPRLKGFRAFYQTLGSGIVGLIPDGYSYRNIGVVQDGVTISYVDGHGIPADSRDGPSNLFDGNPDSYYYHSSYFQFIFELGRKEACLIGVRMRARNTPGTTGWLDQFPKFIYLAGMTAVATDNLGKAAYIGPVPPPKSNGGWCDWIPIKNRYSFSTYYFEARMTLNGGLPTNTGLAEMEFLVDYGKGPLFTRCVTHTFVPETEKEISYDKKLLSNLRVYIANPSILSKNTNIAEVALIDCNTPNDNYYLSTDTNYTQDDPIYNKLAYNYQHTSKFKDLPLGSFALCSPSGNLFVANYHEEMEGTFLTKTNLSRFFVHSRNKTYYANEMTFSGTSKITNQSEVQSVVKDNGEYLFFELGTNKIYARRLDYNTERSSYDFLASGLIKLYQDVDYTVTTSGGPLVASGTVPVYKSRAFWNPHDDKIWLVHYDTEIQFWNVTWSGAEWSNYYTGPGPLMRHDSSIVFDRNDNCVWLYGGHFVDPTTGIRQVYDDFWKFDIYNKLWTCVFSQAEPAKRYGTSLAVDIDNNHVYLYGGNDGVGNLADTWVYDKRWNTWTDMSKVYGKPYMSPTTTTTGSMGSYFSYDHVRDNFLLIGGGLPLNILAPIDPYEQTYFFNKKGYPGGYYLSRITDEHTHTGGMLLSERESTVFQLSDVPSSKKLYYAEVRLYYDPTLGPPSGVALTTLSGNRGSAPTVVSNWKKAQDYIYSYIWSDLPMETLSIDAHNTQTTYSGFSGGPIRINELAVFPLTYSGTWAVENNFNLIESSYTTTVSGVAGMPEFIFQKLSTPHLERLITDVDTPVPLLPGYAIGMETNFNDFGGKSKEIRVYTDSPSGVVITFSTQASGEQAWSSYPPTWNGQAFSYVFHDPENVRKLKINMGNVNALDYNNTVSGTPVAVAASSFTIPNTSYGVTQYKHLVDGSGYFADTYGNLVAIGASGVHPEVTSGTRFSTYLIATVISGGTIAILKPPYYYDTVIPEMKNLVVNDGYLTVSSGTSVAHGLYNTASGYATPVMTAWSSPSPYQVLRYGQQSWLNIEYKAFDQDPATGWNCVGKPAGIGMKFNVPRCISKIRMYSWEEAAGVSWPSVWQFQASDDGSTWVTLYSVAGQTTPNIGGGWSPFYTFPNASNYLYYRIYITDFAGEYAGFREVHMVEDSLTPAIPIGLHVGYSTASIDCNAWAHINKISITGFSRTIASGIPNSYQEGLPYDLSGVAANFTAVDDVYTLDTGSFLTRVSSYKMGGTGANTVTYKLAKRLGGNSFYLTDLMTHDLPYIAPGAPGATFWATLPEPVLIPNDGYQYSIAYYSGGYGLPVASGTPSMSFHFSNQAGMNVSGLVSLYPSSTGQRLTLGVEYAPDVCGAYFLVSFDSGSTWKMFDLSLQQWKIVAKQEGGVWSYLDSSAVWIAAYPNELSRALQKGIEPINNRMNKIALEALGKTQWEATGGFVRGLATGLKLAAGFVNRQPGDYIQIGGFTVDYELFSGVVDATYDQIRWVKAVQLINCGDEIDFGTTGSGENTLNLPTYYRDYNKISIFNNNRSGTPANARVLPRFSGNYHLDRTIRISEDATNWASLEDGVRFPEDYPWEMGKLVNARVSEDQVLLADTSTSGTWRSPVIEVLDPSSTAAYVYVRNIQYDQAYVNDDYVSINNLMKVRASHEKPMQVFLATAVNTDNDYGLQAPWKAVLFRSDGNAVNTVRWDTPYGAVYNGINAGALDANDSPGPPRRYWDSSAPYLWQFYGALDSRAYAGVSLGLHYIKNSWEPGIEGDQYRFYQAFPSSPTFGPEWGDNDSEIHIFDSNWVMLPIFNRTLREVKRYQGSSLKHSWQMVDVVYRPEPFYELYEEHYFSDKVFHARNLYKFKGTAATPEYDCEIDYLYSFEGTLTDLEKDGIRCAACADNIVPEDWGHYYWMHYACDYSMQYYKTLLVNGTSVEKTFDHITRKFNFMVEAGEGAPTRGFWGITQTAVYWYSYDGATLTEMFGVSADNIGSFKRLHYGCTDYMNNLWFVDLATERVIRVNYLTQSVDYSRVVPGVCSVACDPYDNSAYLYVIRAPEFPAQDCIKLVHVGDYDYLDPPAICSVPNVSVMDSFNVNLIGRSTSPMGYYDVLPEDPLWGEGAGSLPWVPYSAGSPTLPKGIYKQLKLTLRRSDLQAASPEIDYLRIPVPAIINKIPWKGYKDIFVDTIPRSQNYDLPAGTHTLDLLVWWTRE